MITAYIKNLININKTSNEAIAALEQVVNDIEIKDAKDKANFGNMCILLRANRMIAEASEAMLMNEDVLQNDKGEYYQKIVDEEQSGSDSDIDKKETKNNQCTK